MPDAKMTLDIPFANYLGVEVLSRGSGQARLALEVRPELENSWQSVQGGVTMTLLDLAMTVAMRSMAEGDRGAVTVEMKVNFTSTGKGRLLVEGRVVHAGGSLSLCEAEVRDAAGALVAKAMGTFKVRRPLEVG